MASLKKWTLRLRPGSPFTWKYVFAPWHGMCVTEAAAVNADLLQFLKG
jgi:hypothetical protein